MIEDEQMDQPFLSRAFPRRLSHIVPCESQVTPQRPSNVSVLGDCRVNSTASMADMTLKEAVEYLSHSDENYQQCGATFIQHATFKEERTKQEVGVARARLLTRATLFTTHTLQAL